MKKCILIPLIVLLLFGCSNKVENNVALAPPDNNEVVESETINENEVYEKEDATSIVYYTHDLSSDGLLKVYNALNQEIVGNVGIKVSFGDRNEQILNPELLKGLIEKTNGVMFDGNGLSGHRATSERNLAIAKENGYTDVGKCIMVSDDDYIDMPVNNGLLLNKARTGKEFDDFNTLISVHRVKLHNIQAFGGNIKNVSLCLANISGKSIIHSGGKDDKFYHNTEPEVLMKSFADATKAAIDYKKNWAFIDVLDDIDPVDSCKNTKHQGKIGIIASNDIVALEQCAVDFLINKAQVDEKTKNDWKEWHQIKVIEYCEQNKIGNRIYKLVDVDNINNNNEDMKKIINEKNVNLQENKSDLQINDNDMDKLKLYIDDVEVDVDWEDNDSMKQIGELAKQNPIIINSHQYGGFEQVGEIGQNIVSNNTQMTTEPGDIVLYAGNNIVVFYGSNSWSYTKLGKINKNREEIEDLLNKAKVTLKISY